MSKNFCQTITMLVDYIQPSISSGYKAALKDPKDSAEVAFATNTVYWLAFACMQSGHTSCLKEDFVSEIQTVGTSVVRRLLEESDFFTTLLSKQKLSPLFNSFKLPLDSESQNSLLHLLFLALENPMASEDAFKILIVSIKA